MKQASLLINRDFRKNLFRLVQTMIIQVTLLFIVIGCASMPSKHSRQMGMSVNTGDFLGAIDYFEDNLAYETAELDHLWLVIIAYRNTNNYKAFDKASDIYLKRLDKKGNKMYGILRPYDLSVAAAFAFRAQSAIDFGDYQLAFKEAAQAVQHLERVDFSGIPPGDYGQGTPKYPAEEFYAGDRMEVYYAAGLSSALMGKSQRAKTYVRKLESVTNRHVPTLFINWTTARIAKILVVLKEYTLSLDYLNKEIPLSRTEKIMQDRQMPLENLRIEKDFMVSKIFYDSGQKEKAMAGYDKLLSNPVVHNYGSLYYIALSDRAAISLAKGNLDKAIDLLKQAVDVIERQRSTINTEVAKIGFVGNKQAVYHNLVDSLFKAGRYSEAFTYAERGKARALVDMLASKKQFSGGEIEETAQLAAILAEMDSTEQKIISLANQPSSDKHATKRAVVVQKKQKIAQTVPELASLVTVTPPDVTEIQKLLPPDETLVEYFGSGDTLFVFIVSSNKIQGIKLETKELNKEIETFRRHITLSPEEIRGLTISTPSNSATLATGTDHLRMSGDALYDKLIQPVERMIHTKNLTIVPHGALHYLPFGALSVNGQYMIDRYNLRVLPSASVLSFLKDQREGHAGNLLAFGNPDLGDPQLDLPGAQKEAIAIVQDMPNAKLFMRKQATETTLKTLGSQYRYVHFAMHGTFDAEKPLDSGLMMAADSENDGMLTVGELYDLYLPADLVTLSACETALGKIANGDDVVGFTRGFLYAGVSSIVSSLWQVDDQATSIMMQQFYKSLKETDKRQALRTAQLKVKDSYNSHPFFWAAFQITGSVR
ncbi:MAG: CHAT domain-containing protein [Desulfobacterales bacterium]|nr:CHAT domain-containing protein [Desulfobacterales bacterium]